MALILQAQQGDPGAKEELVKQNLGLVGSIVKRFEHRGHDREELFQIGSIGLIKAIDKFDLTYEVAFSTYAVPLISGEIRRFLRDDGLVRISRSLKENGWRIRKAAEKISQEKGREASIQELSEETGLSREDIVMAVEYSPRPCSPPSVISPDLPGTRLRYAAAPSHSNSCSPQAAAGRTSSAVCSAASN